MNASWKYKLGSIVRAVRDELDTPLGWIKCSVSFGMACIAATCLAVPAVVIVATREFGDINGAIMVVALGVVIVVILAAGCWAVMTHPDRPIRVSPNLDGDLDDDSFDGPMGR